MSGSQIFKPIAELPRIKNGTTTRLSVSKEHLPGELILRFDYKETESSAPYPSEKNIFINDQDIELWISPIYSNNSDSTWFQNGERENAAFMKFSQENGRQKAKLGLLQNFLMNYDNTESSFYLQGIREYEQRRQTYNHWLTNMVQQDKALFVSTLYRFQYVPEIPWKGNESDRMKSLINHYFDGMDFKDPWLIKTSGLNKWMDSYVNLYGQLSTTETLRDSLFPLAGKNAIEKARQGHPLVYGWMVDYFFRGFESNNIPAGMKVLEPYLNDPVCLTSKRMEIERRLKGMETLVAGSKAPDIELTDTQGNLFRLYDYHPSTPYILLLFWSADCSHCTETVDAIYPWQNQPEILQKCSVLAISLGETETEKAAWYRKKNTLMDWKHLRADEGIRSKVANDYFILATPVMILMDARTKKIISLPSTFQQLKRDLP